jgi:hypothetical protein
LRCPPDRSSGYHSSSDAPGLPEKGGRLFRITRSHIGCVKQYDQAGRLTGDGGYSTKFDLDGNRIYAYGGSGAYYTSIWPTG